jgi:hypothetical protein
MQTRRVHRAQEKRRWLSITGPGAGEVSGHGSGVERCSTADRRFDHRGYPEGSGCYPGLSPFVSGLIELPDRDDATNNLAPRSPVTLSGTGPRRSRR